jgi:hypothetical protein
MIKSPVHKKKFCAVYNFKNLVLNEKSKGKNVTNSQDSTHQTSTNKYNLFKQMSLGNNNTDKIERNHSSINIAQIKKYSKFRINKNEKSNKKLFSKHSTSKLLLILKNSERTKNSVKKKESITDTNKKTDFETESKKKTRFDNFGNLIEKNNKKNVHIAFKDQLMNDKSITEEILIKSYKKFNYIKGLPIEDAYNPYNNFHKCCCIY